MVWWRLFYGKRDRQVERSSRSLLWQLSNDILHLIYSEWLASWKDLSSLDMSCLDKENRDAWLSSLSHLRMVLMPEKRLFDEEMILFYRWLGHRKVFIIRSFPIRLSLLNDDFLRALDYQNYCPTLLSINIERYPDNLTSLSLEKSLQLFLHQCHLLQDVQIHCFPCDDYEEIDSLLLSMITNELRSNMLRKIDLLCSPPLHEITNLLRKHVGSIQDIILDGCCDKTSPIIDDIITFFHQNALKLRRLRLSGTRSLSMDVLLNYLSFYGRYLETLELGSHAKPCTNLIINHQSMESIATACPNLKVFQLKISNSLNEHQMRAPSQLYLLFPKLRVFNVTYDSFFIDVKVIDEKRQVWYSNNMRLSIEEQGNWLDCLCYILSKTRYTLMTSNASFCIDFDSQHHEWHQLKSKLSPYLTTVEAVMSEEVLIDVMKELPCLEKLVVQPGIHKFTDDSLFAIKEYGYGLKRLSINPYCDITQQYAFTDKMISKMIEMCRQLEYLRISCAGRESILAVTNHPGLEEVYLYDVIIEKAVAEALLLEEENQKKDRSSRLRVCKIKGDHYTLEITNEGIIEMSKYSLCRFHG